MIIRDIFGLHILVLLCGRMPPNKIQGLDGGVSNNPRRAAKSRTGCQTCKVKRVSVTSDQPLLKYLTCMELHTDRYSVKMRRDEASLLQLREAGTYMSWLQADLKMVDKI